jgi:2-polyprenyl-3-methyl-5-hydroxy-6-metoxy-1,4-benzoquinol methylase
MGVVERLSLEAVSANTLIACEHLHRYRVAASLCAGLRVVDLACGSGYGSAILRASATSVVGVDNDAATVDMARATIGAETDVIFEAADAVEYLQRGLQDEHDAIVCLEGLEHLADLDGAVMALSALASDGMRLVVSVPNSRTFGEKNEFHLTDFGFDEAIALAARLGGATVLYQFLAEGSLIQAANPQELDTERVLEERGESEYANHFIVCANLDDRLDSSFPPVRMQLAAAPVHNRYMLGLERGNRELWRENARLARERLGRSDAAAATALFRLQRELRMRAERAEERNLSLEAEVEHLRERVRVLEASCRDAADKPGRQTRLHSRRLYGLVRRLRAFVRPR